MGNCRADSLCRLCRLGGVSAASPLDEYAYRPLRFSGFLFRAALAGFDHRGGGELGSKAVTPSTSAADRSSTDSGPVWSGLSGMYGAVWGGAGKSVSAESLAKKKLAADWRG